MAALTPVLREFILRNQDRLLNRKFLISILTVTLSRPKMDFHLAHIEAANKGKPVELSIENSMSAKEPIEFNIPDEAKKQLDPLSLFMVETKIPVVREDKDPFKLFCEYQNFLMFSDEDKAKSDEISMKHRNVTNAQFFIDTMNTAFKEREIFEVVDVLTKGSDKPKYVAEFRTTGNRLAENGTFDLCILSDKPEQRLMTEIDTFTAGKSDIVNMTDTEKTTVGRLVFNEIALIDPFSDKFPYINRLVNLGDGDVINDVNKALAAGEITVAQYKKCLDNLFFITHFTELCCPCLNEKAIQTDPAIAKRKAELYKQYAGQLDDPQVITKIEDELIAMDKNYMKGDTSMRFYGPLGGKSFDLWRKKLYIAVGGIEAFDKDTSKYEFLQNSLEEGQRLEDLPKYGNESRKGSYQRGHETRNGGALTKYIIRAFHDSRVQEDDCGTTKGLKIDFRQQDIKKFKGRFINLDGKWTEITDDNINKIPPKTYTMRSPMYCQCKKNGYCYKCMGSVFANLKVEQLAMSVVDISTTFMNAAMKNMHGSKLKLFDIESLDQFIL